MNNRPTLQKFSVIGGACVVTLSTALFFQNCAKFSPNGLGSSSDGSSNSSSSAAAAPGTQTGTATAPVSNKFSLGTVAPQSGNLGAKIVVPVNITASAGYSGTLNLSVEESALRVLDTGAAISFSFSPASVMLSAGASQMVQLTINVDTMSPSFANKMFNVVATDSVNALNTATIAVPLSVAAIYNVDLQGRANANAKAPENWTLAVGQTVSFIPHSEGLVVNFRNMDKSVHLIHSDGGPIPHESTTVPYKGTTTIGLPPSPDGGNTPGGIFTNTVAAGAPIVSIVYCHDDESSAQNRTLRFNNPQPTAPTTATGGSAPTPTTNPNATFTFLRTNVFQTSCVGCHSAANPAGQVNLSTYVGVTAVVNKSTLR